MKQLILIIVAIMPLLSTVWGMDIKGRVVDVKGSPMEFVNVVLLQDSTFVSGVVTNSLGEFNLSSDLTRGLNLRLSSVGFEIKRIEIPIDGRLGNIEMLSSATQLQEVEVQGQASRTYLKGNALVTNVENSILAHAGTAKDVLSQIPMVIENHGELEVFGKGVPVVYINGHRVIDALELTTLLSGSIRNVEVITSPGASYAGNAKAVIRIRTKRTKGEGWSGTLRATNGFQHEFQSSDILNLKYRIKGFEIFSDITFQTGKDWEKKSTEMTTHAQSTWFQRLSTDNIKRYQGILGRVGFSWTIGENHCVGAYYQNGYAESRIGSQLMSHVEKNNLFFDRWETEANMTLKNTPQHAVNVYYIGQMGKLYIDWNADYIWKWSVQTAENDETSELLAHQTVATYSKNMSSMLAEKLVLAYPVGKGMLRLGEEYVSSRTQNVFKTAYTRLDNAASRIREDNVACFVEVTQQLGLFNIGAGMRYEHVDYDYYGSAKSEETMSRTYHNFFPSVNASIRMGDIQMSLSYSGKVERPTYSNLNANVSYLNRMTYEAGNPRLQPTKLHTLEYMTVWKNYFAQVSYSHFQDPIVSTTKPYSDDGEIAILTYDNFNQKHFLQAFMGGQFKLGVWQPRVNVGMFAQWFHVKIDGRDKNMNKPIGMLQCQNAIHLPLDIWLNLDAQFTTAGNDRNIDVGSTSCVNAKLYKDFCQKRVGITLEARDIFNGTRQGMTLYSNAVTLQQKNLSDMRCVTLTLQFTLNTSRDRYRGNGAGNMEKKRF